MKYYLGLTWVIFLVCSFLAPLLAAWRISRARESNAYNNYVKLLLLASAANNFISLISLRDLAGIDLPAVYVFKRLVGLFVESAATILLSLYLLGLINGIGWFGKPPPPPAE